MTDDREIHGLLTPRPEHIELTGRNGGFSADCNFVDCGGSGFFRHSDTSHAFRQFLRDHTHGGEAVEVLPDAPEAQPAKRAKGSLAARLIAMANDIYGNDTGNVLDAPTGHGLAAVIRALADGPLIQTEWAAAQFRKLAVELEVAGRDR